MFAKISSKFLVGTFVTSTLIASHKLSTKYSVQAEKEPQKAICIIKGEPGHEGVSGIVNFTQLSADKCLIEAELKGLPKGKHGFHIHAFGDLSKGCTTAGPHFNPFNKDHGGPSDKERHVGDLGNIESKGESISAIFKLEDQLVKIIGDTSILGRSVVVHLNEDDLGRGGHSDSKTTGHAGGRVACGVIGRSN